MKLLQLSYTRGTLTAHSAFLDCVPRNVQFYYNNLGQKSIKLYRLWNLLRPRGFNNIVRKKPVKVVGNSHRDVKTKSRKLELSEDVTDKVKL